ncbi:MAG: dTMP kinase [Gammaproteobacteria bacterium]|nr:dTMP kinase [Gammaproteobacteria bacterium]MDE0253039.1 dTMP kinase [Gammaproteobacteria bacterium]MDE0402317.1 dTMP kinase [Gammaproteobacteria bacterium]
MANGKFITLEGIDGVGKSSLVPCVNELLGTYGFKTLITREPGGTPVAEAVREILLLKWDEEFAPATELLLMFAARSQHVTEVIAPALNRGVWVICERFSDASYAYQSGGRNINAAFIDSLAELVHGDYWPDLTLYLDVDVELARKRRLDSEDDRIEGAGLEFFRKARERYRELASRTPRIKQIDASRPRSEVKDEVCRLVREFVRVSTSK